MLIEEELGKPVKDVFEEITPERSPGEFRPSI